MDSAHRHRRTALAIDEPFLTYKLAQIFQRIEAGRVPFEEACDDRGVFGIDRDDVLTIGSGDIAVAERRFGWPDALLGLLAHALAGLLRQVVDVVLRHQYLDAVHELFRRARAIGEYDALFGEVDLGVEFVDGHPVLEITVEPVSLLDQ
jgi:hypothetical protein